ncbi:T9SS type B sorting domain-containing protein [Abyssalbus ytuae]|uniref:T9SS type B sorting domain-containing protein n=1 Tax=Abyssalbus ytuae TaxID=2926907 RepID=A0A9E7D4T0_9FLAO|nr:T9SS type B sorting domain-containing protein [Abyssalbus ytuae]UOB19284.1 T9SS type B sorting domain-containing protein [Abyssalbus ytuae]
MKIKLPSTQLKQLLLLVLVLCGYGTANAQVFNDFEVRYQDQIRGDLTIIANNIVNRDRNGYDPEDPYNRVDEYNDDLNMRYIDVDSDGSTFSSSRAVLDITNENCSIIRYAGLYWGAMYKDNDRNSLRNIKFMTPGSSTYMDISADEVLFDGYNHSNNLIAQASPYICYKDVTATLNALGNPDGTYTVANVRASQGTSNSSGIRGGVSGGWTLVVVYEDPTLPGKFFTTFDGFAAIDGNGNSVNVDINGFITLPSPFPVRANFGVSALEGDYVITGDRLRIRANSNTNYTTLTDAVNPGNNFFNSSISSFGAINYNRTPASLNTLGWDADLIRINNPGNSVIPNDETGARFRATTSGDQYFIFFNSFDVEVIEPEMQLVKTVEDGSGNDIGGEEVNLGQTIEYIIEFQNIGNDDATNFSITDELPANVDFEDIAANLSLPAGVTYVYDAATHTLTFTIPDNLVVQGLPDPQEIRFSVNVVNSCFELRDACSNIINNQAFATYSGILNSNVISDDPSFYGFDNCDFGLTGPTNFLAHIDDCTFVRDEVLCGNSITISAGAGFDSYQWYTNLVFTVDPITGRTIIDTSASTILPGETNQDLVVTAVGEYGVVKVAPSPCLSFDEVVNVVPFTNALTNPVVPLINNGTIRGEVETCSNNGEDFPKIYLCGLNDNALVDTDINDAQSLIWEQLNTGSCTDPGTPDDNCPNTSNTCTWTQVYTGNDYVADTAGEFRLRVVYQNDCQRIFYFDVYTNELDPEITPQDIICNTPGSITVDTPSASAGYEFQLVDNNTGNPIGGYQTNNVFNNLPAGDYYVNIRQTTITDGCVFPSEVEQIRERVPVISVNDVDPLCPGQLGSATVQLNDVEPDYTFELIDRDTGSTLQTVPAQLNNFYEFTGLAEGNYTAIVRTANDGCEESIDFEIESQSDLSLTASISQNITCRDGNIQMNANGGQTPYNYAIYSHNGTLENPGGNIGDYNWQTSVIFDIPAGEQGTYVFIVIDGNNCTALSNEVEIIVVPDIVFNIDHTDETCFNEQDGTITINVTDNGGYNNISYSIDNGVNFGSISGFIDLAPGTYDVIVRGIQGSSTCDSTPQQIVIDPATQLGGSVTLTQGLACPSQLGIITFSSPSGGSGTYEYSIGGTFQSSPVFSNLSDGTYTPVIRDANNPSCTFPLANIVIDPLNPPTDLSFVSSAISCTAPATDVTVSATGGTTPLTYEMTAAPSGFTIPPSNTTGVFTSLDPGTYTFEVTDADGCTYSENYTINNVTPISVVGSTVSDITCAGDTDGEITFTVSDFSTTYSYTINGAGLVSNESNATININALAAGSYTIEVTDDTTGCTDDVTITVNAPPALNLPAPTITNISCSSSGFNPGSATTTATGGWGGFVYELQDGVGTVLQGPQGNGTFNNLTAGSYNIVVRDANGCEASQPFTLTDPASPVLSLSTSITCYNGTPGTINASISSGGTAPFNYELNTGDTNSTGTFNNITPGTYTVTVTDANGCSDNDTITIEPELTVTATADDMSTCDTDTNITINPGGGDGNYTYAVVTGGSSPSTFSTTNPVNVTSPGTYDVYVRDNNGTAPFCEDMFTITILQDPALTISASNTPILCYGDTSTLTITAGGGSGIYEYSIDNGATFQTSNTFNNITGNDYDLVVRDSEGCTISTLYSINGIAEQLTASANVTALIECNPTLGAEVRITNVQGGTPAYEYSFDGGANYGASNTAFLFEGTYTLFVRDANMCTYEMSVTVEPGPTPPANTFSVDYNCDGTGNITLTTTPATNDYTYDLDGSGSPQTSNVFNNITPGDHIVTVNYISNIPATPSILLLETFGAGATTNSPAIDAAGFYCFEDQAGAGSCGGGPEINDGEYTITSNIVSPFSTWHDPTDHTGNTNGRMLVMNVGNSPGPQGTIYEKAIFDITPNQPLYVNMFLMNLLDGNGSGAGEHDPDLIVELIDGSSTVIASAATGLIPKVNTPVWTSTDAINPGALVFNPGTNTSLTIRIRTNSLETLGNDVAIDDITVYQDPQKCPLSVDVPVTIDAGHEFSAASSSTTDVSCNGGNDGSITFTVENFGTPNGFEWSFDNFATAAAGSSTTSPVTIPNLPAGIYTLTIRDVDDAASATPLGCLIDIPFEIFEPTLLVAGGSITVPDTCDNDATIVATATDGTPGYEYELQDNGGTPLAGLDFTTNGTNDTFAGIPPGDYIIAVRDANGCTDTFPLNVPAADALTFSTIETNCYAGDSNGTIQVDVLTGNGDYIFSIDGNPGVQPTPVTATTYTFTGLTAGSYDITVTDGLGCDDTQTVVIDNQLLATANIDNDLTCLAEAQITITASGGDISGSGAYGFSYGTTSTGPFTPMASNIFNTDVYGANTIGSGDYYFEITDDSGCNVIIGPYTITPADPPVFNVTPTDVLCNGDNTGALSVNITSGIPPYTIEVFEDDGTGNPTGADLGTTSLSADDYVVVVTDSKSCSANFPVTIDEPDTITDNGITPIPITCGAGGNVLGSINVDILGGTPDYTYYLYDNLGALATTSTANPTGPTSSTTLSFSDLDFGNYYVRVIDANNCEYEFGPFEVASPPSDLDITSTPSATCVGGVTQDITVVGGEGPYQIRIYDTGTFVNLNALPSSSLNGFGNEQNHQFTGLQFGVTYVFEVLDTSTNCTYIESVPAVAPPSGIDVTGTAVDVTCNGAGNGTINFTVSGYSGTDLSWEIFENLTNNTTGITGSAGGLSGTDYSDSETGLGPGEYYITVTETTATLCSDSFIFRIEEPTPVGISLVLNENGNCNEDAHVTVAGSGGTPPYQYAAVQDAAAAPLPAAFSTNATLDLDPTVDTDWDVYVMDANGCIIATPLDVIIADDPSPEITVTLDDNCAAEGTFEATVTLDVAGIPPYTISVNAGAPQVVSSFPHTITGLSSNTGQTIEITDANNCGETENLDIFPPMEVDVDLITLLDCETPAPAGNAEILIEASGGSGNYEYEITAPVAADNEARTVLPINPYTYSQATTAGTYTITVYDVGTPNTCPLVRTVEVPARLEPTISVDAFQNVTCEGSDDGTITVSVVDNGTGPYTFTIISTIDNSNAIAVPIAPATSTATTATFTGLDGTSAGAGVTYTIQVTTVNSCSDTIDQLITEPALITVPTVNVTEFACASGNNVNTALLSVDTSAITGGSGTYVRYEFIPPGGSSDVTQDGPNSDYTVNDLTGGTYTINVYDTNGCVGTTTATVAPFTEISNPVVTPVSNTCTVGAEITFTVDFTPPAATPNMTYTILGANTGYTIAPTVNAPNSVNFAGLPPDTYTLTATNTDTGCTISTTYTVPDPNTFTIDVNIVNNVICFGTASGAVNFTLNDAAAPYAGGITYEVFDVATNTSQTGGALPFASNGPTSPDVLLAAGNYYVRIIQVAAPECQNDQTFTIAGPSATLNAATNITDITCDLGDGIIEIINPTGGWGGYTYFVAPASDPAPTFPGSYVASPVFNSLGADTYQVWIADQNGCEFQLPNEVLTDPTPLTADLEVVQFNCNGTDGIIQVTNIVGGQGSNQTFELFLNGTTTGNTNSTGTFNNLGAGTYTVEVSDQWNCSATTNPVTLFNQINPVPTVSNDLTCARNDGEITVTVTGGSGNFNYEITAPAAEATSNGTGVFSGLDTSGTYTIVVTDLDTAVPGPACSVTVQANIEEPTDPVIDVITPTPVSCNGGDDGSVTITLTPATDDDPPYTYTITNAPATYSGSLVSTNGVFTDLTAGTYDFTVESALGCTVTDSFTITEPAALDATAAVTQEFACDSTNGAAQGEITVTVTAGTGTPPYVYSMDGVNFFNNGGVFVITDTGADQTINFTVQDANGCTFPVSQTITTLPRMILNTNLLVRATCPVPTETVEVQVTGLPLPTDLLFEVLGTSISQANNPNVVLPGVGSYTIQVTDVNTGCFETITYDVLPYDTIDAVATNATPITCIGDNDGTIVLEVTGYSGLYDYVVLDDTGTPTTIADTGVDTATGPVTITGLPAGGFTVQVTATDPPQCTTVSNNIVVPGPSLPLDMTLNLTDDITCAATGTITALATGGWNTSYSYTITYPVSGTVVGPQASGIFTNLSEGGTYSVDVTDAGGCTITRTINVLAPVPIVINNVTPTVLLCEGDVDGTITVDVDPATGRGSSFFQYILTNIDTGVVSAPQTSNIFTGLSAGNYEVTVTDGWGCDATQGPVAITEPTEVFAEIIQISPLTCTTQAEIQLTATGGTAPYLYSASATGPFINSVPANFNVGVGQYQFYVQDANGCVSDASNILTIEPITPLAVAIDDSAAFLACADDTDAVIRADASGGLGDYMYEIYDADPSANPGLTPLQGPQSNAFFSNLGPGTYYVRVESVDCEVVSRPVPITAPDPLVEVQAIASNPTCTGENNGQIIYEVSGGTGVIKYAISPDLEQFDVNYIFTDLTPGTYTIIAQDENGCYLTREFTIVDPEPLVVNEGAVQQELCAGDLTGSIEVLIEGGTAPYRAAITYPGDTNTLTYEDVITSGTPPSPHTFGSLAGGITYTILIEDANECRTSLDVTLDPSFDLTAEVTVEYGCTDNFSTNTVTVNVFDTNAADADLIYSLDGAGPGQFENVFTNVNPGDHIIEIMAPNGCLNNDATQLSFTILDIQDLGLDITETNLNEFTYNGTGGVPPYEYYVDGVYQGDDNVYHINRTDTYTVTVIDSNGCEYSEPFFIEFVDIDIPPVFTPDGDGTNDEWQIDNDQGFPNMVTKIYDRYGRWLATLKVGDRWKGLYDGNPLPTGDYWYVIKINGENDPREFIGHFTLYR